MTQLIYTKITNYNVKQYTIFGERHSGTKLMQSIMQNNTSLALTWDYGWKHWFGFTNPKNIISATDTLFIGIVRNPYNWILSFFREPHHVPRQNRSRIDNFLFNEWYSVNDAIFDTTEILLDRNFITKQRYKNIFEMRKHKIYYLRQIMPNICSNYILISYDTLIKTTAQIIEYIQHNTNQSINRPIFSIKNSKPYADTKNICEKITSNIDWNFESTIGYHK